MPASSYPSIFLLVDCIMRGLKLVVLPCRERVVSALEVPYRKSESHHSFLPLDRTVATVHSCFLPSFNKHLFGTKQAAGPMLATGGIITKLTVKALVLMGETDNK